MKKRMSQPKWTAHVAGEQAKVVDAAKAAKASELDKWKLSAGRIQRA
jgi:hypothetical protein